MERTPVPRARYLLELMGPYGTKCGCTRVVVCWSTLVGPRPTPWLSSTHRRPDRPCLPTGWMDRDIRPTEWEDPTERDPDRSDSSTPWVVAPRTTQDTGR